MSNLVEEDATHSRLEERIGTFSKLMAGRFSRRSLIGRVGSSAVAASIGTSASLLYDARSASACYYPQESEYCANIMGTSYCDTTYGCYCGCWNSGSCSFCDCCDKGSWCSNHHGCTYPYGNPTCCNRKVWTSPSGCGTECETLIICRDGFC